MAYRLDDTELFLFGEGTNAYAYRALGCHFVRRGKHSVARFAVWAPNAERVSVVGDFNGWQADENPMTPYPENGVWEAHVAGIKQGDAYKYAILTKDGQTVYRADPFAFYSELRPGTASRAWDISNYKWNDSAWLKNRKKYSPYGAPVSIFEVHLGSWHGEKNYREIADELAVYAAEMGFTHVELMPLSEYPFDGSWGYQVTGYFSATARYGTPQDLMYLVDKLHGAGIGVIMDWVPAHFPRDEQGLRQFDGTACYESSDPREAEQPQWGTMLFNYARSEVRSFLLSSALFWVDVFHCDGIRADAVSCMLYRDYGKDEGQWVPNRFGGKENLEAIDLLRRTGELLFRDFPGIMFCAEESTSYPLVTHPREEGGLSFNYKWNMGWMNDMLEYMSMDPLFRKWNHDKLTFSMYYAFTENFILPLSHDEVVHGKRSLIEKMPGDYEQKFAGLRAFYSYMFAHPGKKLLFMGNEIAQFIEWRYYEPIEYDVLLQYDMHRKVQSFVKELNTLYRELPALHEIDDSWDGFTWLVVDDAERSTIAFARTGEKRDELLVCVFNFTPVQREGYTLPVPRPGKYREIMNSDRVKFGGQDTAKTRTRKTRTHKGQSAAQGAKSAFPHHIELTLPPLSGLYLKYVPEDKPAVKKTKKSEKTTSDKAGE